jgi:hypothetical protein
MLQGDSSSTCLTLKEASIVPKENIFHSYSHWWSNIQMDKTHRIKPGS